MFLGIDLGTSEVKALLMNRAGLVISVARAPLQVMRPFPRWSEQSPDEWWRATLVAIDHVRARHPKEFAALDGIGLSGQMHGATLLDRADRPLRPAILWNDTRSDAQCAELVKRAPRLEEISGNRAMPGFTAPKLLWVAENEPQTFEQVACVLLPKDYVRLCLTGDKVSDMSDASGTLWLDVAERSWSPELLEATGLGHEQMPGLVEGNAPSGNLRRELAVRWGIRQSVTVAGGAGDNAASAIGIGAVAPGDGFTSLGTSGVVFVVNDGFRPNPRSGVHTFCHAIPNRWHQMSVMLSAASCLSWIVRLTGASGEHSLLKEVAALEDQKKFQAPLFLPYLSGERTPHNDPYAQGVFFGLTHDTGRAALGYAVLEGVAFGLADGLDALGAAGSDLTAVSLVGGGARSVEWAQTIADVVNKPVHTHEFGEAGAAIGAARLAQMACGDADDLLCVRPPTEATFFPRAKLRPILEERLERYRALYRATKSLFANVRSLE